MIVKYTRWTFISLLVGLAAGLSTTFFLYALTWLTKTRDHNGFIIWCLPLAGLIIGAIYHHYGQDNVRGTDLVLDEIYEPQERLPAKMAPLILGTTLMTHFFGGSAGREGTAVQMGASLADQWGRWFSFSKTERKMFLVAGMGAGFGAAIGAPLAGTIFGIEVTKDKSVRGSALFPSLVASLTGYGVTLLLHAPHTHYPEVAVPPLGYFILGVVIVAGLFFGAMAKMYMVFAELMKRRFAVIRYPPLRPMIGGAILLGLYHLEGSYQYVGLGLDNIQSAFLTPSLFFEPFYKLVFTALTISSGFKGGEFIPLVFIGATLGSTFGVFFPSYFSLLASLGFASVFGAASKTPMACSVMAIEIFGWSIGPYVIVCCFVARFVCGRQSLYEAQRN